MRACSVFERICVAATLGGLIYYSDCSTPAACFATASTHIWDPSTDVQEYGVGHVTADVYIPAQRNGDGSRANAITNSGLTFGFLPFEKLNLEAGFDYKTGYGSFDSYPIYFNTKLGIPENAFGDWFPALAGGVYDLGTKRDKTDYNVWYWKAAKTPKINDFSLGRFSLGTFWGKGKLLVDSSGARDNHGMLLAWERTMNEISDKLWVCAEYQGTKSSYGAFNIGLSWQFAPNVSVIGGYQFYNNRELANTATIQVDINFDVFSKLFKKDKEQ